MHGTVNIKSSNKHFGENNCPNLNTEQNSEHADIKFRRNFGDELPVYTMSRLCSRHRQTLHSHTQAHFHTTSLSTSIKCVAYF